MSESSTVRVRAHLVLSRRRSPIVVVCLIAGGLSLVSPARPRAQTLTTAAPPAQSPPGAPSAQGSPAQAQPSEPRVITLDDALALAEEKSEQVAIARAGINRAQGGEMRAKSETLPQVSLAGSYDRALASEFSDIFDVTGPSCTPLTVNPTAPIADRVTEIERALEQCPPSSNIFGGGGSGDGNETPFGQRNTVRFTLQFSQNLYSGGRITAQRARARVDRQNADLTLTTTRAQLYFDVAQAYYDAALSDRLVAIAEETFAQAERTFEQTRQQREAGRLAEFDLLRAQVSRDTQRPQVIRTRNQRDLAYLRLKQLLELPLDTPLQLTVRLDEENLSAPAQRFAAAVTEAEAGVAQRERAAIQQAANTVQSREADVRIARSERLPSLAFQTSYGRVGYPSSWSTLDDFRTNSTVGLAMSLPIFTGGRLKADELVARASVAETQAQLALTRELATLDTASARTDLSAARATWESTAGVVQQAQRAYEIAELRYREGLSTQLELSDARLLLQQSQANRAQAARDVQVSRVKLALLPDLPLSTGSAALLQQAQGGSPVTPSSSSQTTSGVQTTQTGGTGQTTTGTTTGRTGAQPQ
jgi:outer membrane protein TolC